MPIIDIGRPLSNPPLTIDYRGSRAAKEELMSQADSTAAPPMAEPQKEHRWLRRFVGEWTYKSSVPAQAGQTAQDVTGTESVRAIGDLWVVAESRGEMPGGGPATSIMTIGYNPETKRFVGTWIGSMMTHMWVYDGELDAAGRVLALTSEGPSMESDGTMSTYQDVIEFKSDDHRVLTARVRGKDGTWQSFMSLELRRA
jgi:hypothetical protein